MRKGLVALSLAVAWSVPAYAQSPTEPATLDEQLALFKSLCFDGFPDGARFTEAVAAPALGLTKQPAPASMPEIGTSWTSAKFGVGYVDSPAMPRDLPNPQCSVVARAEVGELAATGAPAITAALGLPAGKVRGKGLNQNVEWNMPGRDGDTVRMFYGIRPKQGGSPERRLSLLNLRGKRK